MPVDEHGKAVGRGNARARRAFCATSSRRNPHDFRIFGPDETVINRLSDVFEVTDRQWEAEISTATTTSPPAGG